MNKESNINNDEITNINNDEITNINNDEITNNKELIKKIGLAYCLYCIDFKEIKYNEIDFHSIRNETTGICPYCHIDCLVRKDYTDNFEILKQIHNYRFE